MKVTDEMVEAALKAHYSAWGTAKKSQDMYRDAMRAALEAVIPLSDPAAWQWLDTANFRKAIPESSNPSEWNPLYRHPALSHAAGQEAVAWRVEWDMDDEGDAGWVTLDRERGAMGRANEVIADGFQCVRIRPLYLAPPTASAEVVTDAERYRAIRDEAVNDGTIEFWPIETAEQFDAIIDRMIERLAASSGRKEK